MSHAIKSFLLSNLIIQLIGVGCADKADQVIPPSIEEVYEPTIAITSTPPNSILHNELFEYRLTYESTAGDTTYVEVDHPDWMEYDAQTQSLTGTPGWANLDQEFRISVLVTNEIDTARSAFIRNVALGEILCHQEFGEPSLSTYILPYAKGKTFNLGQSYCPSNPNWGHHKWFAYDFDLPIGEPVIASRKGIVLATRSFNDDVSDCSGCKENYVFVLHEDGTVMSYIHLQQREVHVAVGDTIQQGQMLGLSGNSGCTGYPHLHIALFRGQGNYGRQYTLPLNYKNAEGEVNSENGLIMNHSYLAL